MKIVKREVNLTKEQILEIISAYDIYRMYFGEFTVNKKYLNHLRGDKTQPSFMISNRYTELIHIDMADDYWRGNCISFVQQINRCSFQTALRIIDRDFNLGLMNKEIVFDKAIITWKEPKIIEEKKPAKIQCITQKFTKLQLDYWNQYELGIEDLRAIPDVEIHSIKTYYLNNQKMPIEDITFGYLFGGEYWKIYKPYSTKNKWLTNCPIDICYGLNNIKTCNTSLGLKSVKDVLVSYKFLTTCSFGTQNESSVAISDDTISYIHENSEKSYIIFDADIKGIESCKFYNSKGFGYWNIPKRYYNSYGIKDPSDFVYRYGGERLRKEVNKKIKL